MITLYPYSKLGGMKNEWLDTKHHFSFADYVNPDRMGFGQLRVINDDIIKAKTGFGTHPHKDMEIITYVRKGAISHKDSAGHEGKTEAGDVQVMSAGTGIAHSEHNLENEDTTLYQIWIKPRTRGLKPSWAAAKFPKACVVDQLSLLVSGRAEDKDKKNVLTINQDASIYGGRLAQGTTIIHRIKNQAYVLLSEGKVTIDGQVMEQGDGCEVTNQEAIEIIANTDSEIVVIDVVK